MEWCDRDKLERYEALAAMRRQSSIPGEVETDEQKAERERLRAVEKRAEHASAVKHGRRGVEKATSDFLLIRFALGGAVVADIGIVAGWIALTLWGLTSSFTGGAGGPLAFSIVALVVCTILAGIGTVCAVGQAYENYNSLRVAKHQYADSLERSADFDIEQHWGGATNDA